MTEVERSKRFDGSAEEIWAQIGDFQGLDTWHPGIAGCAAQEGGEVRELTLEGGGTIVERCLAQSDRSYSYRILDPGPLPVADYEATITVSDGESGGSVVLWRATFSTVGAPEADAIKIIEGIFDSGLEAL